MYNTGGKHRAGSKKNAFGALAKKVLAGSLFSVGSVLPSSVAVARQARLGGDAGSSSLLLRRVRHPVGVGVGLPLHDP